mmetsp:Transcript_20868/g.42123  ORF Transcript_20868/g.42123 Transcript_20868/m.42123 type:complete len:87 (-) Transcript_20868:410-670(-)
MICALILPTEPLLETGGRARRNRRHWRRRKPDNIEMAERRSKKSVYTKGIEKVEEEEVLLGASEVKTEVGEMILEEKVDSGKKPLR